MGLISTETRLNFCTLFNSAYLSRGLLLYHSLIEHHPNAHLYVFAFDDHSFQFLTQANYPSLSVISLDQFEDPELLKVKPGRSAGEYCWTCTSSTILYCIKNFNLSHCTYVDADLYFFSDPLILIDEMGDASILITEHRYSPQHDQSRTSGIYCVQFITFKNDEHGLEALNWWRNACIDWCYARHEDGKFGDQKYLDDWTTRFKGVHVLQHQGGGIAPWNVQQYSISKNTGKLNAMALATGFTFPVVFFHFHALKFHAGNYVELTGPIYELKNAVLEYLYKPYIQRWKELKKEIKIASTVAFDPDGMNAHVLPSRPQMKIRNRLRNIRAQITTMVKNTQRVKHYMHFYKINDITQ